MMRGAFAIIERKLGSSVPWVAAAGLLGLVIAGGLRAAPEEVAFKTLEAEVSDALKSRKQVNSRKLQVQSILRGTTPLSGNEPTFDEYYTKYLFPSWTMTGSETLGELAKDREQFLISDLGRAAPGPHDRLVELAFSSMVPIAQDPEFHPGVRYNAVLVLGGLNAKESDRINKLNPEPLPKSLDVLLALYKNPDEADAVRVAALLGIVRHLEWDEFRRQTPKMAADKRAAVVSELFALAGATDPPAGRSLEGHTWMRRRALEGLMYASPAGRPTAEVAALIAKLVASDKEPVSLRCTAADIMGRLDYQAPAAPAAEPSARELGHLALVACDVELTKLEEERKQSKLRSPSSGQFGAPGGMMMPGAGGPPAGMMGPQSGMSAPPSGGAPGGNMADMMKGLMPGGKKGKKTKTKPKAAPPVANLLGNGGLNSERKNDEQLEYIRRRMRAWLYAVQMGLGDDTANPYNSVKRSGFGAKATITPTYERGVIAFAAAPQDAYVKEVIDQVQKVISIVEAPNLDEEAFLDDLQTEMDALAQITRPLKKEEPAESALEPADDVPGAAPVVPEAAGTEEAVDLVGKKGPAAGGQTPAATKAPMTGTPAGEPVVPDAAVPTAPAAGSSQLPGPPAAGAKSP